MSTITDKPVGIDTDADNVANYYDPEYVTAQDYYPFGMLMPDRIFTARDYRFGFNGKEKDDEVKGDGNQQDYGFRIYDPRIGRFLSLDPLTRDYPWYSPYQFAGNKPIWKIDMDGLEEADNKKPGVPTTESVVDKKVTLAQDELTHVAVNPSLIPMMNNGEEPPRPQPFPSDDLVKVSGSVNLNTWEAGDLNLGFNTNGQVELGKGNATLTTGSPNDYSFDWLAPVFAIGKTTEEIKRDEYITFDGKKELTQMTYKRETSTLVICGMQQQVRTTEKYSANYSSVIPIQTKTTVSNGLNISRGLGTGTLRGSVGIEVLTPFE